MLSLIASATAAEWREAAIFAVDFLGSIAIVLVTVPGLIMAGTSLGASMRARLEP